ncbi:MAG: formylmethanofuran dehydrogenase [Chloroflexota bacterium]|nr:MAG: formylmethanofuran dehydrogenase [Chloroflexota bacterium]
MTPTLFVHTTLEKILDASASQHQHLCPRQVLGARMGLLGAARLGIVLPRADKRLRVLVETDGCAADGISAATGCYVGRRTLRVIDYGKVAATFVDVETRRAVRIAPRCDVRALAASYAPEAATRWEKQLLGYQRMLDAELLRAQEVTLTFSLEHWLSKEGARVHCAQCGEEILNEREIQIHDSVYCLACIGGAYYEPNVNKI